uniref:Uncharacterized protein n=1 Tax=Escherichia coli TaxID=562 RepID=A0A343J0P4_ECOLX|nr:hypothetical protein ECSA44_05541 [Escherichia coli]
MKPMLKKDFFQLLKTFSKLAFNLAFTLLTVDESVSLHSLIKMEQNRSRRAEKKNIKISYFPEKISNTEKVSWGT